jgi:hypothetical protein
VLEQQAQRLEHVGLVVGDEQPGGRVGHGRVSVSLAALRSASAALFGRASQRVFEQQINLVLEAADARPRLCAQLLACELDVLALLAEVLIDRVESPIDLLEVPVDSVEAFIESAADGVGSVRRDVGALRHGAKAIRP